MTKLSCFSFFNDFFYFFFFGVLILSQVLLFYFLLKVIIIFICLRIFSISTLCFDCRVIFFSPPLYEFILLLYCRKLHSARLDRATSISIFYVSSDFTLVKFLFLRCQWKRETKPWLHHPSSSWTAERWLRFNDRVLVKLQKWYERIMILWSGSCRKTWIQKWENRGFSSISILPKKL